jgi:hypothetical protein
LAEILIPAGNFFEKTPFAGFHRAEKAAGYVAARITKVFDKSFHDKATCQRTSGIPAHAVGEHK